MEADKQKLIALEDALGVVSAQVQKCRIAAGECRTWSPAQGEWLRAQDACLNIADALRALATKETNDG